MALPSGTYSSSLSGPLQIFFSGEWTATTFDWGGSAPSDIVLKCTVTDGTTTRTAYINRLSVSASIDWDYTTGTTLTCSMSEDYWNIQGAGYVKAEKLRIRALLMKR